MTSEVRSAPGAHVAQVFAAIRRGGAAGAVAGAGAGSGDKADWVTQSWLRSIERHRLDPAGRRDRRVLDITRIREAHDRMAALLEVAAPDLEALYQIVTVANYCVVLTDADGLTLDFRNRNDLDGIFEKAQVRVGTLWSEELEGTCGVGTALVERRPVLVHKDDHFRVDNLPLSCSAAPIVGTDGELLAVLDASTLYSPYARDSQALVFNMVAEKARVIENAYADHRLRHLWRLTLRSSASIVALDSDWMIAFDDTGRIVGGNRLGRERLAALRGSRAFAPGAPAVALSTPSLASPASPLTLEDLFGVGIDRLVALASEEVGAPIALSLLPDGRRVHGSLRAPARSGGGRRAIGEPVATNDAAAWSDASGQVRAETVPASAGSPAAPDGATSRAAIRPPSGGAGAFPHREALELSDARLAEVFDLAGRVLARDVPIVLLGETGTGKEALARALHEGSRRRAGPFVAINCAAIPEGLVESELFGYKAGAFTGARSRGARGLIQQADGGMLFLDEIGDMPLALQSRLLRVLAEGEVLPLGADAPVKVDIVVICATHQDLPALVAQGRFREDLYFRIAAAVFHLPALRERTDIEAVVERILAQEAALAGRARPWLAPAARAALLRHRWPGNVRQLRNALRYARAVADGDCLRYEDLPADVRQAAGLVAAETASPRTAGPAAAQVAGVPGHPSGAAGGGPVGRNRMRIDRPTVLDALARCGGSATQAARWLGVPRSSFYRRLAELGIRPADAIEVVDPAARGTDAGTGTAAQAGDGSVPIGSTVSR